VNDVLIYIVFALLVFVFRVTVVIDNVWFSDLDVKKIADKLVRKIIWIRRFRIVIGTFVLGCCGGYIVFSYALPPIMSLIFWMFKHNLHFVDVIPSNTELFVTICVNLILILAYFMEKYLFKQLQKYNPDI
jgi:hypothetical protein